MQKYILYLWLLVPLFCASCNRSDTRRVEPKVTIENSRRSFSAIEFTFEEHDYIYFRTGSGKFVSGGVVHDPNCKCFKQDNKY